MNSKLIPAKYLAVFLLGVVFLILASVDAFSATEINIGSGDTYSMNVESVVDGKVTKASINVVKTLRSKNYNLSQCTFKVELQSTSESYSAHCMEAIVKLFVVNRREIVSSDSAERFIDVDLDFAAIGELEAMKYGLDSLEVNNGVATFIAADLSVKDNYSLRVKVMADRRLLKDKVIINRTLTAQDFSVQKLDSGKAMISIDLNRLSSEIEEFKAPKLSLELRTLKTVNIKDAINYPNLSNALSASLSIND